MVHTSRTSGNGTVAGTGGEGATGDGSTAPDAVLHRLKALADEKRLAIVGVLSHGERCVCDLQEELQIRQSLLSFHLRTLKDVGLVRDRRDGRWAYYALDREAFAEIEGFVRHLRSGTDDVAYGSRCCE